MPTVKVEEKEVTITTRVFACEFTENEVDAIVASLERSVSSYSSRRSTPEVARVQRTILRALKAHEKVVNESELEEDEDEEDEGELD